MQPQQDVAQHGSARRRVRQALLLCTFVATCLALLFWSSPSTSGHHASVMLPADGFGFEQKTSIGDTAREPHEAMELSEKRTKLMIEQDLKSALRKHTSQRQSH